jgi:low affinity Fe/Cu permease
MRTVGWFTRMAKAASRFTGRPLCFMLAVGVVLAWIVTGPIFGFSNTWQLVINTGTTITTFLMVFLLQNTGNRTIAELQDHLRRLEHQNSEILSLLRDNQVQVRRAA